MLDYLVQELGLDTAAKQAWYCHWVGEGLRGIEKLLVGHPATGTFCHGDTPTFADCCLVPQLYNARRFNCALDNYPTLLRIDRACAELDPFRAAAPENQPDAE